MHKLLLTTAILGLSATTAFADESTLTITDFIGTVNIEEGSKITVSGDAKDTVSTKGDTVTIDGGETIKSVNCKGSYGRFNIKINDKGWSGSAGGYKDLDTYPTLDITAPNDVHLIVKNSVIFGQAGDIGSADLSLRSCGELEVGNISGNLDLNISGSADFEAKNTGPVKINIGGSGDVTLGDISSAEIALSGSGDIEVENVNGPLVMTSKGSGDFVVENIMGNFVYEASGSSDAQIENVSGSVAIEARGSSDVRIDEGETDDLLILASGSSDVDFDGVASKADLTASGSSNIRVNTVTGEVKTQRRGSADIHVDGKAFK